MSKNIENLQRSAAKDNRRAFFSVIILILFMLVCVGLILNAMNREVEEIKKQADANYQALRESSENETCILSILAGPEKFPGADPEKCKERLRGLNNEDGTFLGEGTEFPPTPVIQPGGSRGATGAQGPQGNTGSQGPPGNNQPGPIQGILNSVGNAINGILQ